MGKCRWLYENKITFDSLITVSSQKNGVVTQASKEGTGSAIMTTSGAFTGGKDLSYRIEIDGVAAGAEVGQATFRWSDGSGSWNATGVATSNIPILLNNGVYIAFASGTGDDFVLNDNWVFVAMCYFGPYRLIDNDRDTVYRSAALGAPNTITIDLLAAKTIDSIILYDHNLTSGATIVLRGNSSNSWGSPAFSKTIAYNAGKILQYLTGGGSLLLEPGSGGGELLMEPGSGGGPMLLEEPVSTNYRYWQIQITDAANPDNYIEIANMGLYEYMELSNTFANDWDNPVKGIIESNVTQYGTSKFRFYNYQEEWGIQFNYLSDSDMTLIESMRNVIGTRNDGIFRPLYFNVDSEDSADFSFVYLNMPLSHKHPFKRATGGFHNVPMTMTEVVRSI